MSALDQATVRAPDSVFRLVSPQFLAATLMLAGGVALYAIETYITSTIAPSIVRDIGGLELLSWMTSLYVAPAVLGSIFVAQRPHSVGLRGVYVLAALAFAAGSLVSSVAPSMPVVLVGRIIQGFGTGALAALGYSFIRFVYPEPLWPRASTLYAAIWGIATVIGPTLGGLFSSGSSWRYAFVLLVPLGLLMAALAPVLLPRVEDDRIQERTPLPQIGLLLVAVLLVGIAATIEATWQKALMIGISLIAVAAMGVMEKRSRNRLLPATAMTLKQPLARIYLAMFAMTMVMSSSIYIPYLLQTLHRTPPLVSGYLVALVALGWTIAAFITGGFKGRRASIAIVAGCLTEAIATASLALLLGKDNPAGDIALLAPATIAMFMVGVGVGLGWAHLVTKVLGCVGDNEQDKASSAIPMLTSLASAFGASFAGVIVNSSGLVEPGGIAGAVSAAHWLYTLMALPGIAAFAAALSLMRSAD